MTIRHFFSLLLSLFCFTASAQEGAWSGDLNVMGNKLPLVFHFDQGNCSMDSPSQGAFGIKAECTREEDGKLTVKIPVLNAVYAGTFDGKEIHGSFMQNGFPLPLDLKPGVVERNRPQTPVGPFPYSTEDVTFYDDEVELHGTLTLPEGVNKKTPLLVMVTGSGLENRDEEIFEHKPFAVIADAFARQGIATLRYDDRGYDDPSQFGAEALTTYHFRNDALAAIVRMRDRFEKVGVLGHSEGGLIALQIAAEKKADFIISMAGVGEPMRETLLRQNHDALKIAGIGEGDIKQMLKALDETFDQLVAGKNPTDITAPDYLSPAMKMVFEQSKKQMGNPTLIHMLSIDVTNDLPKIKCPVMAINGTWDVQVNCEANLDAIRKGLAKNKKAHIKEYDGLNHLFQHCQTGAVTEYIDIEETISPEVLNDMIVWIKGL